MSYQVLQLAINEATAIHLESHSLQRAVDGFGEFPDAVFDLTEMLFNYEGAKLTVRAFRNAEALAKKAPLPGVDPIILQLSWEELRGTPGAGELEAAVRAAAWSLMTSHPKMLRGAPPAPDEKDTRKNAFDAGALTAIA